MSTVDVVIPVYNEERVLADSVSALSGFLAENLSYHDWRIVIADNGSTDGTLAIAADLASRCPEVAYVHLEEKGRGRALRKTWLESPADVVSYMDVDLSSDIHAFPALVDSIAKEGYDIATGSRLSAGSLVRRSFRREFLSRSYNLLIKAMFFTKFSDAQCGFKAVSRTAVRDVVPSIKDQFWFFDTELLILAAKRGYRLKEIPIKWEEDPDSRVNVRRTAIEDIKGLVRLRMQRSDHANTNGGGGAHASDGVP